MFKKLLIAIVIIIFTAGVFSAVTFRRGYLQPDINSHPQDDLAYAATRNADLRKTLKWTFGSKPQLGWHLYSLLLQKTLKTDADTDTQAFAQKVSEWQTKNRLSSTGIIDRDTLFSFIKFWQSRRVRPIVVAADNKLLSAPISDFYDPTRNRDLLKVEKKTYAAYKEMIAAAANDKSLNLQVDSDGNLRNEEKFLKIISSFRSPEYQASLRKKEPGASRAQIAINSPHFTGRALDIYVGGDPVTSKDFNRRIQVDTKVYKWLVKNAGKFGFVPYFFEPWHWEYAPEFTNSDN
ncbi:MAG: D-alanyl-D-alanine carboxypeptidase family protein [Acidobacteria bacterium]|nr:D-alanyl-D-alanine carboxypeptidase family protein [Acidobacteriota bacterium]